MTAIKQFRAVSLGLEKIIHLTNRKITDFRLGDFPQLKGMMLNNISLKKEIRLYAKNNPSEETCGLIVKKRGGDQFIPCKNYHPQPSLAFSISPHDFLRNDDIVCVYHSHPKCSSVPSKKDRLQSDELRVPFLIYSLPDDSFNLYINNSV